MKIINYTEARENLRRELDLVVDNSEPTCIVSRSNQVVMMSKDDYDILIETFHVNKQLKSKE